MPYTAWPTGTELAAAIAGLGMTVPAGVSTANVAQQAADAAHSIVGYPFIEQASSDTLIDAPYSDKLWLPCWYSAISAVAVGVNETNTTGTVLNIGTDVFLKRNERGIIYCLEFASLIIGSQESIKVTGTKGYSDEIPEALWQAVLDYGVALFTRRARAYSGVLVRLKQGDTEKQWAETVEPGKWFDEEHKTFRRIAKRYSPSAGVC